MDTFVHPRHEQDIVSKDVLGTHVHGAGTVMVSYSYAFMRMSGLRDGASKVSNADVLETYMMAPQSMNMQMHMFGLMYGVSGRVTLMAMLPLVVTEMEMLNRMGMFSQMNSNGLGDFKLGFEYIALESEDPAYRWLGGLTLGLPTGSINQKGNMGMAGEVVLPYPMQLGSGSYDLRPSMAFLWDLGFTLTVAGEGIIQLSDNDRGYRIGNAFAFEVSGNYQVFDWFAVGARISAEKAFNIVGQDPAINPMMSSAGDPRAQGFFRLLAVPGISFDVPRGPLVGNRIAVEGTLPFYQNVDGPQLGFEWAIQAGWQYTFDVGIGGSDAHEGHEHHRKITASAESAPRKRASIR